MESDNAGSLCQTARSVDRSTARFRRNVVSAIRDYVRRHDDLLGHRSAHNAALSARRTPASRHLAGRRNLAVRAPFSSIVLVRGFPRGARLAFKKECAVLPLPKIALSAADYPRLEQLARVAAQRGDVSAMFLILEIKRAEIVPDDAPGLQSIVTIGSWITYWTNWGVPRKTVQLVWPEDCTCDLARISVLSPLGTALIGLQVGDQMPYFVAGCMNVVRIESVTGPDALAGP